MKSARLPQLRFRFDRQGMSLVEIMIGLAIGAVGLFGAAALLMNTQASLDGNKLAMARDESLMYLRRALDNPDALRMTAIVTDSKSGAVINPFFKSCMSGLDGKVCPHARPQPIQVYDRMKTPLSGPFDTATGMVDTPLRFDINGAPCVPGASAMACPIAVSTYFQPNCSPFDLQGTPAPTACARAEYIEVFYIVQVDPTANGKQPLRPITGSIFVSQQEFPQF